MTDIWDIDKYFVDNLEKHTRSHPCESLHLRHTLMKVAIPKNTYGADQKASNLLFPPTSLRQAFPKQAIKNLLSCTCNICRELPGKKSQSRDHNLADGITADGDIAGERLRLFAVLIFMGAGFSAREVCSTVVTASDISSHEEGLLEFFQHLKSRKIFVNDGDTSMQFLDIFKQSRKVFCTPSFKSRRDETNRLVDVNLPFIEEQLIDEKRDGGCKTFRFKIHHEFCESELHGVQLFRKEVASKNELKTEGIILDHLYRYQQPNLINLLFWYIIDKKVNYFYKYYPYNLEAVLAGDQTPVTDPPPANYHGSVLKHRLWQGLVELVLSLSFLHEPRSYVSGSPRQSFITHFDVKPANIMVTNDCTLILADFGDAQIRRQDEPLDQKYGGDINYSPPPSNNNKFEDLSWGPRYDVWSIACVAMEIIEFIIVGKEKGTTNVFQQSRVNGSGTIGRFWTRDYEQQNVTGERYKLSKNVEDRLRAWQTSRTDKYLRTVAHALQKMLSISFTERPMMNVCHTMLSQTFLTDKWPLCEIGEEPICGLSSKHQLRNMDTQFERIDNGMIQRCKLYMLLNQEEREYRLAVEFEEQLEDGKITIHNLSRSRDLEQAVFMPLSLFQSNFQRKEFAKCAFGKMHPNLRFIFRDMFEYYLFLTGTTRQDPCILDTGSGSIFEIPFQSCKIRYAASRSRDKEFLGGGYVQIWQELTDLEYEGRFINYNEQSARQRPPLEGQNVNQNIPRRVVMFLHGNPSSCLTITLNSGKTTRSIERNDSRSDRHLLIKYVENNKFRIGEFVTEGDSVCPGIPVDPKVLQKNETVKVRWIELQFEKAGLVRNFQELFSSGVGLSAKA